MITWNDITVRQFQAIYKLSSDKTMDDLTRVTLLLCIIYNKTEKQVDEMKLIDFNKKAKECAFLLTDKIPGKAVRFINVGIKKYGIQYNPKKLRHRQYVEINHFSEKHIENMHLIMASLVQPVKFGIWKKNEAKNHVAIANDMLEAKVIDVYHTCLFFCKLYASSIKVIKDYLIRDMMNQGTTRSQAELLVQTSINVMDGFIQPASLLNMNVSA